MKLKVKKSRLLAFSALFSILMLSMLSTTMSVASASQQGEGASIKLKKADPRAYGVFIPAPNMYVTLRVDTPYQINMDVIRWNEGTPAAPGPDFTFNTELPGYLGNDISAFGPWYSEGAEHYSPTPDGYINPWWIRWVNLTALNARNATLDTPIGINSVWNQYSFSEGGSLNIPINYSIPMEVDITIGSTGPKNLKIDWLGNDETTSFLGTYCIISPSGNPMYTGAAMQMSLLNIMGSITTNAEYDILQFIAQETGVYKLLMLPATNTVSMHLTLEFIPATIKTLALNTDNFVGPGDTTPNYMERLDQGFFGEWWKISATKGDKFTLDVNPDYTEDNSNHDDAINIWYPCSTGYTTEAAVDIGYGRWDIIAPVTGDIYVTCFSENYWSTYRHRFYCEKIEATELPLNTTETVHVSRDERFAYDFTLEEDTFLRVNTSSFGGGAPQFYGWNGQTNNWVAGAFTFLSSKKTYCAQAISALDTKTEGINTYGYYYLPAGDYEFLVWNAGNYKQEGAWMITTSYVAYDNSTIPVISLSDGYKFPESFAQIAFEADDFELGLKKAKWMYVNITQNKPVTYQLNLTLFEANNVGSLAPYVYPSFVFTYNNTDGVFYDYTAQANDPDQHFPVVGTDNLESTTNDFCYVAYPQKWHDVELNFTQVGSVPGSMDFDLWDGNSWDDIIIADGTTDFTSDGVIDLSFTDADYGDWLRGMDADIPNVDERLYYWLRIDCDADWALPTDIPIIEDIRLSNTTVIGDVNIYMLRDDCYQYCDFWGNDIADVTDLGPVSLLPNYDNDSTQVSYWNTGGIESGLNKLLLIPEKWSTTGGVTIGVNVNENTGYDIWREFNITGNPSIYPWQYTATGIVGVGDKVYNQTNYPYNYIDQWNCTTNINGGWVNYYINVSCSAFNWTQLVIAFENATGNHYINLWQDLPWISNTGPNSEGVSILTTSAVANNTYEFGVLNEWFILQIAFQPDPVENGAVGLKIGLTQYNTTRLFTIPPEEMVPPIIPGYPLLITLGVSVAAIVVIAYTMKRKKMKVRK